DDLRRSRAPVHLGAARLDPAARCTARRAARPDSRPPAEPDHAARRLLVPSSLPVRPPAPPPGRPAAGGGPGRSGALGRLPSRAGGAAADVGRAPRGPPAGRGARSGRARGAAGVSDEPLVRVRDLVKHFPITRGIVFQRQVGAVHAVDGVSFDVIEGETLGIVGETGCGKSTTARLITRLLAPTSGTIEYRGENIAHFSRRQMKPLRREMQIIFQDPYSSLNPRKTVGSIIADPYRIHGLDEGREWRKQRVQELMEKVGLN